MPPLANQHGTPARTLFLIRSAITSAILLFLVVTVQVRKTPAVPPAAIGYTAAGFALLMVGALLFVRSRYGSATTRAERATSCIVGWAMGEGTALFGLVAYFVGNPFTMAVPGLVVFAVSLLLFPIPED